MEKNQFIPAHIQKKVTKLNLMNNISANASKAKVPNISLLMVKLVEVTASYPQVIHMPVTIARTANMRLHAASKATLVPLASLMSMPLKIHSLGEKKRAMIASPITITPP